VERGKRGGRGGLWERVKAGVKRGKGVGERQPGRWTQGCLGRVEDIRSDAIWRSAGRSS
jgi:hypothetical protein